MSRALDDLDPRAREKAFVLLARACERGIPLLIVDTLRTEAEQALALRNGFSSTSNSKHLPQKPSGKSLAIDVVPYDVFQVNGPDKLSWDTKDPRWKVLGEIGESLGFRWGGRWKRPHDPGHFELVP